MIHLRGFRKHDLARLHELDQVCFAPEIAYSQDVLRYLLESPRCFSLVAEDADRTLMGFIIVERAHRRSALAGHVVTIDVDPAMRRQGTGRQLLEAVERQLESEGATLMILEVAEDNFAAQVFYRRFGFVDARRIPKYYAGRLAAVVMEKSL